MSEKVRAICQQCGKEFIMGWTGVCPNGVDLCDLCYFGWERESVGMQQARGFFRQVCWILGIVLIVISLFLLAMR